MSAAFWPGSDNIGQTDWPTATTLAGSTVLPRPALVTAARNASLAGSAWAGAASTEAAAISPANTAIMRTGLVSLRICSIVKEWRVQGLTGHGEQLHDAEFT